MQSIVAELLGSDSEKQFGFVLKHRDPLRTSRIGYFRLRGLEWTDATGKGSSRTANM